MKALFWLVVLMPMSVSAAAFRPLHDVFSQGPELRAAQLVDLEDMVALETRVDGTGVHRLAVDHRGADDQADGHRELRDHQGGPKPSRAGRFGGGAVGLQDLGRLEPR